MRLWVVGQYRAGEVPNVVWDLQGVFDSKELARRACRNESYFVTPVTLNVELPEGAFEGETYYPVRK